MNGLAYKEERKDYEVINGTVYMMARPSSSHARIQRNILTSFNNYLKGKKCEAFGEMYIFFNEDENLVPDAMIICNPDIVEEKGAYGAPDLVVEILSKSTAMRDKFDKFEIYEKFGVKEYWIVDPFMKCVDVYHLKEGKFVHAGHCQYFTEEEYKELTELEKADVIPNIKVSLYDDLIVTPEEIFARVK